MIWNKRYTEWGAMVYNVVLVGKYSPEMWSVLDGKGLRISKSKIEQIYNEDK